jgi:hypothetical protein
MRHQLAKRPPFVGGFTDLFILGMTAAAGGASDFTAAATTQAYNLDAFNIGDMVVFPCVHVDVITALAGGSVSAATLSVGHTGAGTAFITTCNVFATTPATAHDAVAATVSLTRATSSGYLTADLATTGGNVSTLTAGEVWIWAAISRKLDRVTMRTY